MLSSEASFYLRNVFKTIFESVKPKKLISSQMKVSDNRLIVNNEQYPLNYNCYIVGFGKAVYEMGCEVQKILERHLIEGILSVPEGSLPSENSKLLENYSVKVYEGAKNNIPDRNSYLTTTKILELVGSLTKDDVLLVLISGGGSALLVSPVEGVSLEEKARVTQQLAQSGADITELNTVRARLSQVKGGQLAMRAYPATVITLILSDVIGDPLEVIASGPTVLPVDRCPLDVLRKYSLIESVPSNVLTALTKSQFKLDPNFFVSSYTHVIGNNTRALSAGKLFIENGHGFGCILTASLQGQVGVVAKALANFLYHSCHFALNKITEIEFKESITNAAHTLDISEKKIDEFSLLLRKEQKIYLLLGGETTVLVKGKGRGGRNMELALRFSYEMNILMGKSNGMENFEIGLLSGGTDGIDGPTDAAGAISYPQQVKLAKEQGLNILYYIENNDSYNFFQTFNAGQDLIVTGHTGTNVMDVIIIYMRNKFL